MALSPAITWLESEFEENYALYKDNNNEFLPTNTIRPMVEILNVTSLLTHGQFSCDSYHECNSWQLHSNTAHVAHYECPHRMHFMVFKIPLIDDNGIWWADKCSL